MKNVLEMSVEELRAELTNTESFTSRGLDLLTAIELKLNLVWNNTTKKYQRK